MQPDAHNDPGRDRSRSSQPGIRRDSPDADADPILGGADAIEKTTYVSDVHGAEVEEREVRGVPITASVSSGSASPIAWIAAILALLALIAYGAALFA